MCGRYSFVPTQKQLDEQLEGLELPVPLQLSFHIAPTHRAYVIANDRPMALQPMTWGLVPYWSHDGANSGKLINARAEGLLEKPSFRSPALRRHCLVPADSFYEWRTLPGKRKVPYRIRLRDGRLLFMAGIWDEWRGGGNGAKRTFSIITTTPNAEIAALHNRMPVLLLEEADQKQWLETHDPAQIMALLHPPANAMLEFYRVSERLNTPGSEGPELHERVSDDDPTLFA
ncbi:MAG: SOS response-associated peptidase [Saprospirales bacterium]|nr:SOS response-associated peptidase [Saprospirales bacterium]MBK8921712.1 SOS response-associated peptidase [Saprospirales bacterium]